MTACACSETYPQLQPGKLNHGPGCAAAAAAAIASSMAAELLRSLLDNEGVRTIRAGDDGVVDDRDLQVRDALVELLVDLQRKAGIRCCRKCGCTDEAACFDASSGLGQVCAWVEQDLCSACNQAAASASSLLVLP